jgi:hypothetical protein
VETQQILRSGMTASALAHLSLLALVIFFAEVHPFGLVTAETIAVDIVAPDEVADKASDQHPTSKSGSSDSFDLSSTGVNTSASSAAAQSPAGSQPGASPSQTTPPPQQQAALSQPSAAPTPQQIPDASSTTSPSATSLSSPAPNLLSNPAPSSTSIAAPTPAPATGRQASPTQSPAPVPAYVPAQPDLSVKYGVVLGLPLDLPPDKHTDTYDAPAIENADLESSPIAEFRRHIKTCSTLPKEVGPSDKVAIKLRVMMRPDGRLAADPQLIEGTASVKGALLMQNAISALQSCQPYAMLPADKYGEWKVLDISFTPQDFGGAS